MTYPHCTTMDNWLAGIDLSFDHENTGPIGRQMYHGLHSSLNGSKYAQLDGPFHAFIDHLLPSVNDSQYADVLQIMSRAGFKITSVPYEK